MPSFSTNVNLLADKIELICTGSATSKMDWSGSTKWFYRNGFTIKANIGTQKELVKDISLYKKLKTTTSNGLSGTFRTGGANNAGTAVNTATILASGSAEEMDINIASSYPFLVIGAYYQTSSVTVGWSDPGTASVNYNSDITEIWLE